MTTRIALLWRKLLKKEVRLTHARRFSVIYCFIAIGILTITTIYWSLIGASIQSSNADQLANTFLLQDTKTLSGALFPSQHSFFLKIPLFWLINLYGASSTAFIIATVLLSLLTVGGFAFIIWRIERRPLVLGTILLALAAVLLYIPAQSYPGSLLPANFAMLTTRNIEYILFIGALILFLKAKRLRSVPFVLGCIAITLLCASDKLFVSLGFSTAIISGVLFLLYKRRAYLPIATRILAGMIVGYAGAAFTLFILTRFGIHFDSTSGIGPYGIVRSPKDFIIAIVYGILGILTNLGANPAYDETVIKNIPSHVLSNLISPIGLGYVITLCIAFIAIRAIILSSVQVLNVAKTRQKVTVKWQLLLPFILMATSIGAFVVFISSNHYYPADSRYLAIIIFTGFIAVASRYQKSQLKPYRLIRFGLVSIIAIGLGIAFQVQNHSFQDTAMRETSRRNAIVASALKSHPVETLVGNYWRVLPIRLDSPTIDVTPFQDCTSPRQTLSSTNWQPSLHDTGFAYLLQLDGNLGNFPDCSLNQVTTAYGRPYSSIVIAGTRTHPKELLLFFDDGIHFLKHPSANNKASDTVQPVALSSLPFTTCPTTSIMQVVAHEDDDILFMNPDLAHLIAEGKCVRTVFVTAGDAGANQLYWIGRQQGAEAAYNTLLGVPNHQWIEIVVSLDKSHTVTIAHPRGNHSISLIFLHLPDGSPQGSGFASNNFETLQKLYNRSVSRITSVEGSGEPYTYDDVVSSLTQLMDVYKPSQIHTQSTFPGTQIKDHSDHIAVGAFTTLAFKSYNTNVPTATITYYLGYPVYTLPTNVTGGDYNKKVSTFLAFSQFDPGACQSVEVCNNHTVYGNYLSKQYTWPY